MNRKIMSYKFRPVAGSAEVGVETEPRVNLYGLPEVLGGTTRALVPFSAFHIHTRTHRAALGNLLLHYFPQYVVLTRQFKKSGVKGIGITGYKRIQNAKTTRTLERFASGSRSGTGISLLYAALSKPSHVQFTVMARSHWRSNIR